MSKLPGFFQDRVVGLDDARPHLRKEPGLSGGDGGGTSDDMLQRVEALEQNFQKVDGKLDAILDALTAGNLADEKRFGAIENRLTSIETKLDTKASTEAVVKIGSDLAQRVQSVEKDLGTKASAVDMAGLRGAVDKLPTTIVLLGFVLTVLAAAGVMKYLIP